jgi:hypothetical protein
VGIEDELLEWLVVIKYIGDIVFARQFGSQAFRKDHRCDHLSPNVRIAALDLVEVGLWKLGALGLLPMLSLEYAGSALVPVLVSEFDAPYDLVLGVPFFRMLVWEQCGAFTNSPWYSMSLTLMWKSLVSWSTSRIFHITTLYVPVPSSGVTLIT